MAAVLRYDCVEVSYNSQPVVKNISFSLQSGEILGIVGESGSGKTTLLKAAMRLLNSRGPAFSGNIWFGGRNLCALSERELRSIRGAKIGMVFQDAGASLCPVLPIGEQIYESIRAHGKITRADARERSLALFERLNLEDGGRIWSSYPFELSGGMNQRVGIALAMLLRPAVLLADEPTSALDAKARKQVVMELLKVRESFGTAIILVTHDISVVSAIADTTLVLHLGEIVEHGPTKQILSAPEDSYTQELLAAVPRLQGA